MGFCGIVTKPGGKNFKFRIWEANAVFRGIIGLNIDAKGRIGVPTRYRERLHLESKKSAVLTIDTEEKCLLLYPLPEWEKIEEKLAALPGFNPAARRIQRLLIGHATEVELDTQGRILIPPMLRDYAGLKKRVIMVGQGKKLEIWDETRWAECRARWLEQEANESDIPDAVKSISL